jgi:NitT/TauT family transport system substrate-binding protein
VPKKLRPPLSRRALIGTGAAALFATQRLPARAQTSPVPIRIGINLNDSSLGPAYALDQGLFRQAGLNVELQNFSNTNTTAQAIAAGGIDVGVIDCIALANAFIHGVPLAAFAGGCLFAKSSPTLVLVTAKTSAIHGPRDLENQTVAVPVLRGLSTSMAIEWVRVNGADSSKVKFIELPFPDMNTDLQRGSIAAALQGEPYLSDAKAEQRALGVPFEAMGKPFYINVYAASRDWLANNATMAHRLTGVLYDVARWANAHRAESATIESRLTKLPLDVAQTMARNVFATSFDPQLIEPVLNVGARYQLTSRAVHAQEIAFPV